MDVRQSGGSFSIFHLLLQTLKVILLGLFVFSCVYIANHFKLSSIFPIQSVRIYGANHTDHQDIQETIEPILSRGFFAVNVDYIRERLLQMPWVAEISVRRNWPNQVEINVVEKQPVAEWNKTSLLSDGGELFTPKLSSYPPNLPNLVGPDGKQITMLENFIKMNRILMPLHAKISVLEMTPYLTWKLKLDNGIELRIGHKDVLTRLHHFVKVYPKIIGTHVEDVEYVDLRYSNGVAVRWKSTG